MATPLDLSSTKRPLDNETVAQPTKAPRRILPTPIAPPSTNSALYPDATASEDASAEQIREDDVDNEIDPEQLERLKGLTEEEQQTLIDSYFAAKEAYDDAVLMLEGGPETRTLGEAHPDMAPERLQAECELIEELRQLRATAASAAGSI